ncbi:MAG: glycoside hydrolase family 15 protein, partial [Deltaproteobacteria bacterium]|nr:glycoside hydrolase family 15 protein [Deltaproteobacteria bacterium]
TAPDVDDLGVTLRFTLKEGESVSFVFCCLPKSLAGNPFVFAGGVEDMFNETLQFWQRWMSKCSYDGRWSEMVYRSALVLKLLTFEPTGAIVAAPTAGLPEHLGGERNWDYRYTWIRDASFTVYALMRIGFTSEAERFMDWVTQRLEEMDLTRESPISLMYTIHGTPIPPEQSLKHLSGYRGSKPVRIGNGASHQLQLDIFGELMDAVYIFNRHSKPVTYRQWSQLRKLLDWLATNWDKPDESIWEVRGGRQNFVFSRVMCWVAFDRATRMSISDSLPGDRAKWMVERDKIYDQVMTRGWSEERQAFRQHYDTDAIDASNLLLPLFKFISPSDPRMMQTIDATLSSLTADSLVFRYDPELSPDGLSGNEGTFCVCTFWLVECLTRAGRLDEARLIFQRMLSYANHLGLYGEELGPYGETLGNFPQAFTHLGLISAAFNLDSALTQKAIHPLR